jgi:hypothetical protein
VLFVWADLIQPGNPFHKRNPLQQEKSNLPGYIVQLPEPALVTARKRHAQPYDQDLQKVYHNALKAIYQLADSPRLYILQNEGGKTMTLRGHEYSHLNGQSVHEIVPEDQKAILGDYWRVLRLRPPTNQFSAGKPHLEYIPNNTFQTIPLTTSRN